MIAELRVFVNVQLPGQVYPLQGLLILMPTLKTLQVSSHANAGGVACRMLGG